MKLSDYIIRALHAQGVSQAFELSGGMIAHLLDSISRLGLIEAVSVRHEQAAAFAADAVGRLTGIPGVAMATSGPGATNLLTGIGSCYFDSSPAIFITGQVNLDEQKGDRGIRQMGFQETDIVSMAQPITKAAFAVRTADEVPGILRHAFTLAKEGRPGPVLIDIPMGLQRAEIAVPDDFGPATRNAAEDYSGKIQDLFRALSKSERPLILAGGGIRAAGAQKAFRALLDQLRIPVVNSLMAVDLLPHSHPCRVGMIGSYGNRWANLALSRSDLLIVLGSRLDVRQTGSRTDRFKADRTIYHVDCEPAEINNRVAGCIPIHADLKDFLEAALASSVRRILNQRFQPWNAEISALRDAYHDCSELEGTPGINPNALMSEFSASCREAAAFVADVGQHQMWAAQSLRLNENQAFLTSGGMGSMGFGLPAAIGAWYALKKPIAVISGDGGMQCNIQELQTVAHHGIPLKMIVVNNNCHGMVRQFQEAYFDCRFQSTLAGYSAPDFKAVAEAYGIPARAFDSPSQIPESLEWLWRDPEKPALIEVEVDTFANAYPKMRFGSGIEDMEPLRDQEPVPLAAR